MRSSVTTRPTSPVGRVIAAQPSLRSPDQSPSRTGNENGTQEAQKGHKKHKKWVRKPFFLCFLCSALCFLCSFPFCWAKPGRTVLLPAINNFVTSSQSRRHMIGKTSGGVIEVIHTCSSSFGNLETAMNICIWLSDPPA